MPSDATSTRGLSSFGPRINAAVVGVSGGLGAAFAAHLAADPAVRRLHGLSRTRPAGLPNGAEWAPLDLADESSIAAAAEGVGADPLHLVIVATGILHGDAGLKPEKSWRALDGGALETAFRINATGPALVAKHFLPRLAREPKAAFAALSARVGSIADNRLGGWHAYRASKAALNMMVRTMSVELARRNPAALCVALHPGTVDTRLSAPFQANLPEGQIVEARIAAGNLLGVLDRLGPQQSGSLVAWDGEILPF